MYGCKSWTKEGWDPENQCFWIAVLEKTLESPLNHKEINPVILKVINLEYSLEGLMLKLLYFGHLMQRADSLGKSWLISLMLEKMEDRRRGQQRMRWLDDITDSTDMNLSKLWDTVKGRGAWHAAVYGVTKSWTRLSGLTTTSSVIRERSAMHLLHVGQSYPDIWFI